MKPSVRRKRKPNKAGAGPQSIFMYDTLGVAECWYFTPSPS